VKLFFLTSNLDTSDPAQQLALLACGLPKDRFALSVGALGTASGAVAEALRRAGVPVNSVPFRGTFDFSGARRFRQTVAQAGPVLIHAFGPAAARAARLAISRRRDGNTPRLLVSAATAPGGGFSGWFAARQTRRADRVIATGWAEGERYRRLWVPGDKLCRIGPAVAPPDKPPDRFAFCAGVSAPPDAALIFAGGYLDAAHGIRDAVIAFDMLKYASSALQLVLTGDGPDRTAALDLGRALAFDDCRVRFTGSRPDLAAAMQLAEMVWVTCARGGAHLALRAMAAGKPVIAYHTPELGEIIDDGTTGYLVPPGDRAAIAAKAHALLAHPDAAARMGEAARLRATERYSVTRMVEQHARVYQEVCG
jgi:glycosyltransferase involved in cell wall biosynthesis